MLTSLSVEAKLLERLRRLDCSEFAFWKIQNATGKNTIAQAFRGREGFDRETAARLDEVITRMEELARAVAPVPVDWTKTNSVREALTMRLTAKMAHEFGDHSVDAAADLATKNLR